jgi:hypothetical protein
MAVVGTKGFECIEIDPWSIDFDSTATGSRKDYVSEHLKRYCAKLDQLPAVYVQIRDNRLNLTGGGVYLLMARELGRDRIRAFIRGTTFDELKEKNVPGVIASVSHEALTEEIEQKVVNAWYVICFNRVLLSQEVIEIESRLSEFLRESLPDALSGYIPNRIEMVFDASGPCFRLLGSIINGQMIFFECLLILAPQLRRSRLIKEGVMTHYCLGTPDHARLVYTGCTESVIT